MKFLTLFFRSAYVPFHLNACFIYNTAWKAKMLLWIRELNENRIRIAPQWWWSLPYFSNVIIMRFIIIILWIIQNIGIIIEWPIHMNAIKRWNTISSEIVSFRFDAFHFLTFIRLFVICYASALFLSARSDSLSVCSLLVFRSNVAP